MRTLRIDFTAENMLPDGDMIGRMGEHNATDLVITPPAEMAQCDEIVNYVAAFVTEGKIIRTDFYPKAEQITVSLCSQLTQDHTLSLQLEAYDGTGGLVVKSPVVSELKLLPSAGGDETDFDGESGGIVSQINLNTRARHTHSNGSVLDKIGEESGKLTYDGIPVTSKMTKTVELNLLTGEAILQTENRYIYVYVNDFEFNSPPVPLNAELVSLEVKITYEGEETWVNLEGMAEYDMFAPYSVMMKRAFRVPDIDDSTYLAVVYFLTNRYNLVYEAAANGEATCLRVTYVDEAAE